jgi:hypothetical protein
VDINKKHITSEQIYKTDFKDKNGISNSILQKVFLLFKVIISEPPE